ncbi:hypothetical protein Tco_0707830 [Tanacetum coccineum]
MELKILYPYCDASNQGLGCVLMQRGKVIAYASRQLKIHERLCLLLRLGGIICYGTKSDMQYGSTKFLQHIFDQKELNMRQRRWIELFTDYECEIRYHPSKANDVADALSRKERLKPRRENILAESLHGLDQQMEKKEDESLYFMERIWVPLVGGAEIGESSLIGPELVQETTDKVVLIKEKLKGARDRQKSYADNKRKSLESEVGDRVMLKVSPWKGVICFEKKGKLAPRYVGPFEILERIGPVAYRLRLLKELSGVHDTFHVSNLKKCLADASFFMCPIDEKG